MRNPAARMAGVAALVWIAASPSTLEGQLETERFIPIGRSPGVSGVLSVVGEISAVDQVASTVTITWDGGSVTFRTTDDTRIWVDRSGQRLTNLTGSYEDCEVGRRAEVKFLDASARELADWIKVEP